MMEAAVNYNGFKIENIGKEVVIKIDRESINYEQILKYIEKIRIEYLAEKADFSDEIMDLGEEIKAEWWNKNKDEYMNGVKL